MAPNCRWKHSFAESRQCYLFSLFPRGRCQGKREWFSQFSFYFVDIKDGKNQTLKNHLKVVK